MSRDSSLMYTCGLIEYMGRLLHLRRRDVVMSLGRERIGRIYRHADVLHSDNIERVATEFAAQADITRGDFDNIGSCKYDVPDFWTIGEVFERLILDAKGEQDVVSALFEVYGSWISDAISNYNSDLFYQPRDYLRECYFEGEIIAA